MKILKKSVQLYCVPECLVPVDALVAPGSVSIPQGLLPCVVTRSDSNCYDKLMVLMKWFVEHLEVVDGYLVASAALPALSLNDELWGDALYLLKQALAPYEFVSGPVFVRQSGGRTGQFAVADLYVRLLNGSTTIPHVSFHLVRQEGADE